MTLTIDKGRKESKKLVDVFYQSVVDPYKEVEKNIARESKLRSIFKKPDYDSRISTLKKVMKNNKNIKVKNVEVSENDEDVKRLLEILVEAQAIMYEVAESQLNLNKLLKEKSKGVKVKISDYAGAMEKVRDVAQNANKPLRELDIEYSQLFY